MMLREGHVLYSRAPTFSETPMPQVAELTAIKDCVGLIKEHLKNTQETKGTMLDYVRPLVPLSEGMGQ